MSSGSDGHVAATRTAGSLATSVRGRAAEAEGLCSRPETVGPSGRRLQDGAGCLVEWGDRVSDVVEENAARRGHRQHAVAPPTGRLRSEP
jgi:hypothetical protein